MADMEFFVHGKAINPTRIDVKARGFTIVVDEPEGLGGADAGPNPVEYELAALIGCLNVMGHLIAREMELDIGGMEIDAKGVLNTDKLFGKKTSDRAGYKEIVVNLNVQSSASQERLEAWLKSVEERCPVSDNLGQSTPVRLSVRK
jgi:uncharacterized OsmC-like protein